MPKFTACTLAWSSELQRYALFDGSTRLEIIPESALWFAWLNQVSSFSFIHEQGRYTLRKEKKQRGDVYWYAYRSEGKRLSKKYVGKTSDLTLTHLEMCVSRLAVAHPGLQIDTDPPSPPDNMAIQQHGSWKVQQEKMEEGENGGPETPQAVTQQPDLLLDTKLHVPRLPAKLVSRPRLLHLLKAQAIGPLTLISSQAGSGKTVLVAEWVALSPLPVAWLSLEPHDNQPTRFLSYVIAALQRLDPLIGATSLLLLKSSQHPAWETLLALLTNEIASSRLHPITLVLDDYHTITSEAIHQAIAFLLNHLPSHLHLVILTRSDPALPLARLRGRGQMLELRIDDLRFNQEETAQFLHTTTDCVFSSRDVQQLEARTEGWIAGLQLAAFSLRGKRDVSPFVREFAGSNRFVLDYLSHEILLQLPEATLTFLLHTCVLDRLCAPLCSALFDQEIAISEQECQEMLEALEKANLFVSALDSEQNYYRYHALFADVLRARLSRRHSTLIPILHQRASIWLEHHGDIHQAIYHALVIQDTPRIVMLLEKVVWHMFERGEFDVLLGWLDHLPPSLKSTQPILCFYHATALAFLGQSDAAEGYLDHIEKVQQASVAGAETSLTTVSSAEIAAVRTIIATARGELAPGRLASQHARVHLSEQQMFLRSAVVESEALMAAIDGDFRTAVQWIWEAKSVNRQLDNPFTILKGLFGLALFLTHLGQRNQVIVLCEQAMGLATTIHGTSLPFMGNIAIFYALALYENNQLEAARQQVQRGIELCGQLGETAFLPVAYALLAQMLYLEQTRSQPASSPSHEVLTVMQQAEALLWQQSPTLLWSRQHAAYICVRLWITQRNGDALTRLERFYPIDGAIGASPGSTYAAQTESWGLAYIRFGQHHAEETATLLHWPIQAAEQAGRYLALMRMLILQALAYQELGQKEKALANMKRCLQYAEPEGYSALFVEMGQVMIPLLSPFLIPTALPPSVPLSFVQTLLNELGAKAEAESPSDKQRRPTEEVAQMSLTEREMEILRLMSVGYSNQDIALRLVLELSTVKWHIRHIYEKFHAHNRTQVLRQAQMQGLLN